MLALLVLEQATQNRYIAQPWHLVDAILHIVLNQAAQHDDFPVVHQHRRFNGTLVGNNAGLVGRILDTGHLLQNLQFDRTPSATCGLTFRVRPTSLRSMVWNGLTETDPP